MDRLDSQVTSKVRSNRDAHQLRYAICPIPETFLEKKILDFTLLIFCPKHLQNLLRHSIIVASMLANNVDQIKCFGMMIEWWWRKWLNDDGDYGAWSNDEVMMTQWLDEKNA